MARDASRAPANRAGRREPEGGGAQARGRDNEPMTYTGDVIVGGEADTRELPGLTITKAAVGPMNNNAYLLRCTATGELALIDAANEAGTLLTLIGDVPLATIITTHQHRDHWGALAEGRAASGAQGA